MRGSRASQRAKTTFCWLPPESLRTSCSIEGVLTPQASASAPTTSRLSRAAIEEAQARDLLAARTRRRCRARCAAAAALPACDPPAPGRCRRRIASAGARSARRPAEDARSRRHAAGRCRRRRARARSGRRRRGRPGRRSRRRGRSSEQSRTFAVVTRAQLQRHLVAHPRRWPNRSLRSPADHQAHHRGLVDLGGVAHRHQLAVAQHGDPVGEVHDLAQAMADVDDADAVGAQRADHREQALRLVLGQRRGRLVEAQQPHAGPQGAHDLDQLPLRRAEPVAGGARLQRPLEAEARQHGGRARAAGRPSRRTPRRAP